MKYKYQIVGILLSVIGISIPAYSATKVTIGTVNNSDMVRMQALSNEFEKMHDIKLEWIVMDENTLREKLTEDISNKGGAFDVMTIGMYEAPIWGKRGWLHPLSNLPVEYGLIDIFPPVRDGLISEGHLYGLPFYAESSVTFYRKDLFAKAGLVMPEQPTWSQMKEFASKLNNPGQGQYGICLRGKAGWGENVALITTISNSFGARWFDESWKPEFKGAEWNNALKFYVNLLGKYGPPKAEKNGFNENLALFNEGKCAMWVDASVAGSFITDKSQSKIADNVGFALAPKEVTAKGSGWLWTWALAIPSSSDAIEAAKKFVMWATSKEYISLVASTSGIKNVPPGTRASTYTEEYLATAPFAEITLNAMAAADPINSTMRPKPYIGVQFVAIPEFQDIGTNVGELFSNALAGDITVAKALDNAQSSTESRMRKAGYYN